MKKREEKKKKGEQGRGGEGSGGEWKRNLLNEGNQLGKNNRL